MLRVTAGVEVRHLAAGMDSGVGAPGADETHGFGGYLAESPLGEHLHGVRRALALPAGVARSLIFEPDRDPNHEAGRALGRAPDPAHRDYPGSDSMRRWASWLCATEPSFIHFLEDVACSFGIAHVHVGTREIELGADLAHGHGLEVRQCQILGADSFWVAVKAVSGTVAVPTSRSRPAPLAA